MLFVLCAIFINSDRRVFMQKAIQFYVFAALLSFQIQSFASPENNEEESESIEELDQQKSFDYWELIKRCKEDGGLSRLPLARFPERGWFSFLHTPAPSPLSGECYLLLHYYYPPIE